MNLIRIIICTLIIFSLSATFALSQQLLTEVSGGVFQYTCESCSQNSFNPIVGNSVGEGFYDVNIGDGLLIRIRTSETNRPKKVYSCDNSRGCTLKIKKSNDLIASFRIEKSKLVFGNEDLLLYIVPSAENNAPLEITWKIPFVNRGDIISFYKVEEYLSSVATFEVSELRAENSDWDEDVSGNRDSLSNYNLGQLREWYTNFDYIRGNTFSIANRDIIISDEQGGDSSKIVGQGIRKPLILCGEYFYNLITERSRNNRRDRISSVRVKDYAGDSCLISSYEISTAEQLEDDPSQIVTYPVCGETNSEISIEPYQEGKLTNYVCFENNGVKTLECGSYGTELCLDQTRNVFVNLFGTLEQVFSFRSGVIRLFGNDERIAYYTNSPDSPDNLIVRKFGSTLFKIHPKNTFRHNFPEFIRNAPSHYNALISQDIAAGLVHMEEGDEDSSLFINSGIIHQYRNDELKRTINLLIKSGQNDAYYIIRFHNGLITDITSSIFNNDNADRMRLGDSTRMAGVSLLQRRPYDPDNLYLQHSDESVELAESNRVISQQGNSFSVRSREELIENAQFLPGSERPIRETTPECTTNNDCHDAMLCQSGECRRCVDRDNGNDPRRPGYIAYVSSGLFLKTMQIGLDTCENDPEGKFLTEMTCDRNNNGPITLEHVNCRIVLDNPRAKCLTTMTAKGLAGYCGIPP